VSVTLHKKAAVFSVSQELHKKLIENSSHVNITDMEHSESSTSVMARTTATATPRLLFSLAERKVLVDLYDSTDDKTTAMSLVNATQNGEQTITEQRIKRWKKSGMLKPGRPLSVEFEEEVIAECERTQSKESSSANIYPYEFVRMCAFNVFNKDYWDDESSSFIKKWHHDKKTCKLRFSNRWVLGLMQRMSKRRIVTTSEHQHDTEALGAPPPSIGLSSINQKKPSGDDTVSSISSNMPGCNVGCQTISEEIDIIALFQELDGPVAQLSRINDSEFMHIFDFDLQHNTE